MMQGIIPTLTSNISPGDALIVGASGGPDSTALVHLLVRFSENVPHRIVIAHVNHGIRGVAADSDEKFVRALAKKHRLLFRSRRINLKGKTGVEEKGRNARRAFFEKLRNEYSARWILTAHTEDDHIESIIMHFVRGCGPRGLGGIRLINGHYFRPMVEISKKEILAYLRRVRLPYQKDATNADTTFNRNFLRRKIIPMLQRINPSLTKTLARNSLLFGALDAYVNQQARDFLHIHEQGATGFPLASYKKLPEFIQRAILQELHRRCSKRTHALPFVQIDAVARMLEHGRGAKVIQCTYGVRFHLNKGVVRCGLD